MIPEQGVHKFTDPTPAGDTAQCISKDSAFRFENVKRLMFEHFSHLSQVAGSPELAKPELCALYKNYRTHQGILSLASYVMRVLYQSRERITLRERECR